MMEYITKIVAVENATAICKYDPICKDNHVLDGSLDVIMAFQTLAIKVSKISVLFLKYSTSHASTCCSHLDSSVWTAYQVLPEYPDSLWISSGIEDSIAQQHSMGNSIQYA